MHDPDLWIMHFLYEALKTSCLTLKNRKLRSRIPFRAQESKTALKNSVPRSRIENCAQEFRFALKNRKLRSKQEVPQ